MKEKKRSKPKACPRLLKNPNGWDLIKLPQRFDPDPSAELDVPSTTMQEIMELNLAYKPFLWRKKQCSA